MPNEGQNRECRDMRQKNTILFDLDGTLTDPKTGITKSVAYALEHFDIAIENLDELCCFIGPPLKESFMKYYSFCEENAHLAVNKYREYFGKTGLFENELYPGIVELLQSLSSQGKKLILATSKPKIFADRILEHFDIMRYFNAVYGSELDGTRVKKGDLIKYALQEEGITDPDKAVMVGDREHDTIGAKEAGIDCIGVLYGYGTREEFENAGAELIVETIDELECALSRNDQ